MPSSFLVEILLIIVAAFIGGFIARTLKLPPVLGYVVSGILFGILGKNIFTTYETLHILADIGVSLLLFTLGFEISIDTLLKINKKVFLVGMMQVVLTALVLAPSLLLFGLSFPVSILFGVLFSFSSTAVIVKILEEKGLLNDFPGNNIFIFLLIQDLFLIPVIYVMPFLFSGLHIAPTSIIDVVFGIAKPVLIFAGIVIVARLFLSKFLNIVFKYPSHELTILATIFTASFSILALMSVGVPGSIAAFLAGILISEQGKNLAPLSEIRPFRDIFLVLFFVLSGMLLDINFFASNIPMIVLLSGFIVAVKFGVIYILLKLFSYSSSASAFISSYLSNIGEFAVVLCQIALIANFITIDNYNLMLSLFVLTLLYVPFLTGFLRISTEKLARLGVIKKVISSEARNFSSATSEPKFSNHVVLCGHGRVGKEVRGMLDLANIPYVVVDFNKQIINELVTSSRYAIYGDPTDPEILQASFIESARTLVIALPDSFSQKRIIKNALKLNPKLTIICRSHIETDSYDLINIGVNKIVMPEHEAGLRIGEEVLELFKIDSNQINSYSKRLRRQDLL